MSEIAGILKEYTHNFLLEEQKLRKIVDTLHNHATKIGKKTFIRYHVHRKNDSFYETQDIDEVLRDDNSSPKEIETIFIELHKAKPTQQESLTPEDERRPIAYIAFVPSKEEKVRFRITEENRDWCFVLADDLDTQIKRTLKSPIPGIFQKRIFDIAICMMILGCITAWAIYLYQNSLGAPIVNSIKLPIDRKMDLIIDLLNRKNHLFPWPMFTILLVMPPIFLIMEWRPFSRLVNWTTRSVFYWGDAKINYDKSKSRMHIITWGIVMALVIAVFANYITKKIFRF